MSTAVIVPLSEYLGTSYRPDCEYIDGEIRERNLGESEHSKMQTLLAWYLMNRSREWGIVAMTEQRVQVSAHRFRVPDVVVIEGSWPSTPIVQQPPLICIEILSRGDSLEDTQEKIDDYLAFGVPHVWVVNPRRLRGFHYTAEGMREAADGVLRIAEPPISVPIRELESL